MKLIRYIQYYSALLFFLLLIGCKKTNWNENFKEKEKSPFGTYIIYNELKELFNGNEVFYLKENIYDYLFHNYRDESENFGNYICIKPFAHKLDKYGFEDLLAFVYNGNNAFLSLNFFNDYMKETLEISTNTSEYIFYNTASLKKLKGELYLENNQFKNQPYKFNRNIRNYYFSTYNEKTTIVLGTTLVNGEKKPNFIKIYHGKGAIYLHTQPIVFSNYFMINDNHEYAEDLLSYLPSLKIIWDPQIKSSKFSTKNKEEKKASIFKFFLKHPSLKWFLYVSFFGLLLFILFNTKRKQRPISIIKPLKNSTIEFMHTISNLYLKEKDHKNLVDKKIKYFLEKVRTKYLINTYNLNAEFIEKLALKSGNKLSNTKYLINTIIRLNRKSECSEEELMVLHKMIENFLKQ